MHETQFTNGSSESAHDSFSAPLEIMLPVTFVPHGLVPPQ
jgi:hypothetical protein